MESIDIVRGADLALIVGGTRELRVSCVTLCTASEVFRAMLGPQFAEGKALRDNGAAEMLLPDDDPEGMLLLCAALHLREDLLPENIAPETILSFAILADKYSCAHPLKHVAGHWLYAFSDSEVKLTPNTIVKAAYLLDHAKSFAQITGSLTCRVAKKRRLSSEDPDKTASLPGLRKALASSRAQEAIPLIGNIQDIIADTASLMEKAHDRMREDGEIEAVIPCPDFQEAASKCLVALATAGACMTKTSSTAKNPTTLTKVIKQMIGPKAYEIARCTESFCDANTNIAFEGLKEQVEELKKMTDGIFNGLCLDCFKAKGIFQGTCRVQHHKACSNDDCESRKLTQGILG